MISEEVLISPSVGSTGASRCSDSICVDKRPVFPTSEETERRYHGSNTNIMDCETEKEIRQKDTVIKPKEVPKLSKPVLKRSTDISPETGKFKTGRDPTPALNSTLKTNNSDEVAASVQKTTRKDTDPVNSKLRMKSKEMERIKDEKNKRMADTTKKTTGKVITAFGSTYHKPIEQAPPTVMKRPFSSVDHYGRSRRVKPRDVELDNSNSRGDRDQSSAKPPTPQRTVHSRGKLTEEKSSTKLKGSSDSTKKSPRRTASRNDTKKVPSRISNEGDTNKSEEISGLDKKHEIGKELSFFERLQQNVKAYFSARSSDVPKYEEQAEKKKVMEGEKPRKGSFYRSKTLQKDALAPSSKTSLPNGLFLEPDEQVPVNSSYGMASSTSEIEKFHQTVGHWRRFRQWRNPSAAGKAKHRDECQTSSTTSTPELNGSPASEGWRIRSKRKWDSTPSTPPAKKPRLPSSSAISLSRISKSLDRGTSRNSKPRLPKKLSNCKRKEKVLATKSDTALCRPLDVPLIRPYPPLCDVVGGGKWDRRMSEKQTEAPAMKKPKHSKIVIIPKRKWLVYTITEVAYNPMCGAANSGRRRLGGTEARDMYTKGSQRNKLLSGSDEISTSESEGPPSVSLKQIINLSRKIFEGKQALSSAARTRNAVDSTLKETEQNTSYGSASLLLEKLLEEKKNYLNMQSTKYLLNTNKSHLASDSFNFFNLLNQEFLTTRLSNPTIEELKSSITENRISEMKEYLDMYKRVIGSQLTETEQNLMDEAKMELERYTDLYYDLMKYVCRRERSKLRERSWQRKPSTGTDSDRNTSSETLKYKGENVANKEAKTDDWSRYSDDSRTSRRQERDRTDEVRAATLPKNQRREDELYGKKCVGELVITRASKGEEQKVRDMLKGKGNTSGAVAVKSHQEFPQGRRGSDAALIIEQVSHKATSDNPVEVIMNWQQKAKGSGAPPSTNVHETLRRAPRRTRTEDIEESSSERVLKVESDVGVDSKTSEEMFDPKENPFLKFKAFRKLLLKEGIKLRLPEEKEVEKHECPKAPKTPDKTVEQTTTTSSSTEEEMQLETKKDVEDKMISEKKTGKTTKGGSVKEGKTKGNKKEDNQKQKESQEDKVRNLIRSALLKSKVYKKELIKEETGKGRKANGTWWEGGSLLQDSAESRKLCGKHRKVEPKKAEPIKKVQQKSDATTAGPPYSSGRLRRKPKVEMEEQPPKVQAMVQTETISDESDFATPPGSHFECRYGIKNLKDLLHDTPTKMLNPGGLSEGELMRPKEECEEQLLKKQDLSGEEKTSELSQALPVVVKDSAAIKVTREALPDNCDYNKVDQVLNQFMGNITEAWKAASCLKDMLRLRTSNRVGEGGDEIPWRTNHGDSLASPPVEAVTPEIRQVEQPQQQPHMREKVISPYSSKVVDSFREFLKSLTGIFEWNPSEETVRRKILILSKEILRSVVPDSPLIADMGDSAMDTRERAAIAKDVALMPLDLKQMLVDELIASRSYSGERGPGDFVMAVKKVGERLKVQYLTPETQGKGAPVSAAAPIGDTKDKEKVCQQKKIYYRPPRNPDQSRVREEEAVITSNLRSLAEKIKLLSHDKENQAPKQEDTQANGDNASTTEYMNPKMSTYFDARDSMDPPATSIKPPSLRNSTTDAPVTQGEVCLNSIDEGYFSLKRKTFGKYRDYIYDKIINFLKSDNPNNINYGVTLLGRMMDKDIVPLIPQVENQPRKINESAQAKSWDAVLDKLMDICLGIESEVDKQARTHNQGPPDEDPKLTVTCSYLKQYVARMKAIIEEMKTGQTHSRGALSHGSSVDGLIALEKSRETNMQRQLIMSAELNHHRVEEKSLFNNAVDIMNVIGNFGSSWEKISKNILPGWLANRPTSPDCVQGGANMECGNFENNRAIVKMLRKKIERRQEKIKEIIEQATREGIKKEASMANETVMKKVRYLRKCYTLLEKMICDPTFIPPKWLRMPGEKEVKSPASDDGKSTALVLLQGIQDQMVTSAAETKGDRNNSTLEDTPLRVTRTSYPIEYTLIGNTEAKDKIIGGYLTLFQNNSLKWTSYNSRQSLMDEAQRIWSRPKSI